MNQMIASVDWLIYWFMTNQSRFLMEEKNPGGIWILRKNWFLYDVEKSERFRCIIIQEGEAEKEICADLMHDWRKM